MNVRRLLGLHPEQHAYTGFTAHAAVAGLQGDGEVFVSLCDDPGKTTSLIELRSVPALPGHVIYRHTSSVEFLDVIQSYELSGTALYLNYRPAMASLMRAKGCAVSFGHSELPLPELARALSVLFPTQ
ncbi:hypothetical protein [Deinococcus arcticus]|uniref:Uncharacterized protein n=1 Tax=Deinococcus arcticus TaxID=2136176 RepID=A0A2T3W8I0_9DEIO|nr:hypothetical protein [Deinococcus arcticus]PTA68221.1 hypothetical protein C8263_09185 [Deinococcus arcticus]